MRGRRDMTHPFYRTDAFPVVKESRPPIPPRWLTPYSCWTTPRSHMMPKGHRGSSCFLNPAVLGKQETSLEEPYAQKSDHVCKKRDRPAYERDRSANFRTGRLKGWANKAPKGLSTPGRREHEATATGKKAWQGQKNRSSKLEFHVGSASQPFHHWGSRQESCRQTEIPLLCPPGRGEVGEAGEDQKDRARKVPKSPAGKVARYGGFPKEKITRILLRRI